MKSINPFTSVIQTSYDIIKAHGEEGKVETEEGKGTKFTLQQKVRTHWDTEKEQWYLSVIDVIEILTGSSIPKSIGVT